MQNETPLLLAFGDSLVSGYALAPGDGFAPQLERRLLANYPAARVINAGVSGDTTGSALKRLPRLLSSLRRRPDLAIVQLGPNDVLHGVTPARTRAQLDTILNEFTQCEIRVLLTTVLPPAFLRDRAAAYMTIPREVAARHGASICPFFPTGILGRPDMVLPDQVHPNAAAIRAVVDAILAPVERALTEGVTLPDRSAA